MQNGISDNFYLWQNFNLTLKTTLNWSFVTFLSTFIYFTYLSLKNSKLTVLITFALIIIISISIVVIFCSFFSPLLGLGLKINFILFKKFSISRTDSFFLSFLVFLTLLTFLIKMHQKKKYIQFFSSKVEKYTIRLNNFNNEHFIPNKIVSLFTFFCLFSIIGLISYSFYFNFDITDEGYHLYHHIQGTDKAPNFTFFHLFSHRIGSIFNHSLIGYRFASLILILLATLFFSIAIKTFIFSSENWKKTKWFFFISFNSIVSSSFYVWHASFDYNYIIILFVTIWSGAFLLYNHYHRSSVRYFFILILSLSSYVIVFTKFTYGIPLVFFTIIVFMLSKKMFGIKVFLDSSAYILIIIFFTSITYFLINDDLISNLIKLYNLNISHNRFDNSLDSDVLLLIYKYLNDIGNYFFSGMFVFICLIIISLFLYENFTNKFGVEQFYLLKTLSVLVLFIILVSKFISSFYLNDYFLGWRYNSYLFGIFMISSILYLNRYRKHPAFKKIILLFIIAIIGHLHPGGTGPGLNFINHSSISLIFIGSVFIVLLYIETKGFTSQYLYYLTIIMTLSISIFLFISYEQILYSKRSAPFKEQTTYSKLSPYLKNIKLEKHQATHIDTFIEILNTNNFSKDQDRIFVYGGLSGFLSAAGVQSFGESWNGIEDYIYSGYKQAFKRMSYWIKMEPINSSIRYVYILNSNLITFNNNVKSNLNARLKKIKLTKKYFIGKGLYHLYNEDVEYNITLEGPFLFIK